MWVGVMKALALSLMIAFPAAAQGNNCAERPQVLERLSGTYGETRRSIGIAASNQVVEVFGNEDTGTWTITVTLPSGLTCLVAAGQSFEVLSEALEPTGEPL